MGTANYAALGQKNGPHVPELVPQSGTSFGALGA